MNWIIIFSCCLVVSIVFLSFFIYAEKLNRILSKKKEKLTLVKYKNKYYIARVLMILLVIAFGTLLTNEVIAFTNNDLDFTYISSYDEYVKNISRFEFNYDNINNDYNVDKASIDGNYLYLLDDGEIVKVDIDGNKILFNIEKELGVEIVGETKMKIAIEDEEDPWDEIDEEMNDEVEETIEKAIKEDYI